MVNLANKKPSSQTVSNMLYHRQHALYRHLNMSKIWTV